MCEPTHSIVQYRDPNDGHDSDNGASAQSGYSTSRLVSGLSKWAKKIRKWMHLSAMGSGHSETIGKRIGVSLWHFDNSLFRFEANWWNRTVHRDGGNSDAIQLDCAEDYAKLVSIGDLNQLRRFLECSMQNSDRSYLYLDRLRSDMLIPQGQQELDVKAKKVFGMKRWGFGSLAKMPLASVIKFTLGWTRKRKLLVPEWADDSKLWVPEKKIVLG